MVGRLIVVSTPIGNLADLSTRAREALATADGIACEDTRRTGLLLKRQGIKQKLISLHEHNERRRVPELLRRLEGGETLALVSDAGTPLLSDPGFVFVRSAIQHEIVVEHVPGASAILTALVVSGLPPHPFTFAGFVPPRTGKRKTFYARLSELDHTIVAFESPHRIVRSLEDLLATLGDRPVALARELTKIHEEVLRGRVSDVLSVLRRRASIKGEITMVIGESSTEAS